MKHIESKNIELLCWLNNNVEWYYPQNETFLDITMWNHVEILHYHHDNNFLVYCWNDGEKATKGRLFKARVK